jgi:agmatine deiminase
MPELSGYIMPAEWETHAATQLHWPSNSETWPGKRMHKAEKVYLDIIEVLHRYEPVVLLVDTKTDPEIIKQKLRQRKIDSGNVHLYQVPVNDVWARDCGPIFVKKKQGDNTEFAITNWGYNAWGGKYPPYDDDNALPEWFAKTFGLQIFSTGIILEGGSIETNGEGVFLTTESVLLNKNRNPHLNKIEIENYLNQFLGAEQVIWLKNGLKGDDTDGHIDDLSRFVNKNTILTTVCEDRTDVNYETLQENFTILENTMQQNGEPYHIVTLPLPTTKTDNLTVDGSPYVPASYINFYIANGVVLVPLYDERYDDDALRTLADFFPDRDIAGIHCADLVWGQGSIHCITQQLYGLQLDQTETAR